MKNLDNFEDLPDSVKIEKLETGSIVLISMLKMCRKKFQENNIQYDLLDKVLNDFGISPE